MKINDKAKFAKGIGLIVFAVLWLLTDDFFKSALFAIGIYLIVKGIVGDQI